MAAVLRKLLPIALLPIETKKVSGEGVGWIELVGRREQQCSQSPAGATSHPRSWHCGTLSRLSNPNVYAVLPAARTTGLSIACQSSGSAALLHGKLSAGIRASCGSL